MVLWSLFEVGSFPSFTTRNTPSPWQDQKSSSESASNSPAPPGPEADYVELPDDPEDEVGVFKKMWDHQYKFLRRLYLRTEVIEKTGTDDEKQNATAYLIDMRQLERVRKQVNKALAAYSTASTSAGQRWQELFRLNCEYTSAIQTQNPRNWTIPRYKDLYSTHIKL
ncbi:uncharacterized protein PAC_15254 [Phialocephala subalpina]|uniref:Uncharacterized protein n=1 Tax=Phialocephala subalpina TaxID=576137 RepID=A0A1L7XK22_9HELO|nr:uncharacterized protein PAC_15254 [Phialocephala subalpina]